jgi:hypothetical protein
MGVIEVELVANASYILANLPFKRNPCVNIYRILPGSEDNEGVRSSSQGKRKVF